MPRNARELVQDLADYKRMHPEPHNDLERRCVKALELTLAITKKVEARAERAGCAERKVSGTGGQPTRGTSHPSNDRALVAGS
jgi:hypothetical protein